MEEDLQISALAKGLRVLNAFGGRHLALANKDIAVLTGLPRSTVSRLTYTLFRLGYLQCEPDTARYRMSAAALEIAKPVLRRDGALRPLLHPLLLDHAEEHGLFVGLGTVNAGRVLYLDACAGQGEVSLGLGAGARLPLASSAIGRALYAAMTTRERAVCEVSLRQSLPSGQARQAIASLRGALQEIAHTGFCLVEGDLSSRVRGVAVPLRLRQVDSVFALNCGGRNACVSTEQLRTVVGPSTVSLANRIAADDLMLPGELLAFRGEQAQVSRISDPGD